MYMSSYFISQNTTAANKTKVYKQVAQKVIPHVFAIHEEIAAKRIGTKWDK